MQGYGEQEDGEFPYAWLWGESKLSDVSLTVHFESTLASHARQQPSDLNPFRNPVFWPDDWILEGAAAQKGDHPPAASIFNNTETDAPGGEKGKEGGVDVGFSLPEERLHSSLLPSLTKQYLLHSQLICSNSAFFRASLHTRIGILNRESCSSDGVSRWHLRTEMCQDDVLAVDAVLFSFYKQQEYGDGVDSDLLLRIMKVADLWQAKKSSEAASKELCTRTTSFPLSAYYSLPEGLITSAAFSDLKDAAKKALLLRFGNARSVSDSLSTSMQFLLLPRAGLQTLLESAELITDNEATVLLLFVGWRDGIQGKVCSEEQLVQLNRGIRCSCLPNYYLTELCNKLNSPKLTLLQLMELWHYRAHRTQVHTCTPDERGCPDSWFLPPRLPSPIHLTTTLDLVMTPADMKLVCSAMQEIDSEVTRSSPPKYSSGFLWKLHFGTSHRCFWCAVGVEGGSSFGERLGTVSVGHEIGCKIGVWIRHGDGKVILLAASTTMEVRSLDFGTVMPVHVCIDQLEDVIPGRPCMEWWDKHMIDGCMHLYAEITEIDV